MAIMHQPDFSHTYAELMTLLATEASAAPTTDAATLQARYERRYLLSEQLSTLERTLYDLRRRVDHLPWLPDLEQVRWAQALLAFPNLAFLEVDTDGLNEDADILRIVLVDNSGTTLYDRTFRPRRPIDRHITHLTALTPDMVEGAPRLVAEWERVTFAFAGHYILSYNLEFDQTKLRENAERYRLPPLTVVGTCFMQQAQAYFGGSTYPKLATLCAKIGFPLPDHPSQTAFDRVRGQMHLLEAMAQGITSSSSSHETPQHEQNDDPFAVE
jgi:DNA polymerase III epsilon subunit-like protein